MDVCRSMIYVGGGFAMVFESEEQKETFNVRNAMKGLWEVIRETCRVFSCLFFFLILFLDLMTTASVAVLRFEFRSEV